MLYIVESILIMDACTIYLVAILACGNISETLYVGISIACHAIIGTG